MPPSAHTHTHTHTDTQTHTHTNTTRARAHESIVSAQEAGVFLEAAACTC